MVAKDGGRRPRLIGVIGVIGAVALVASLSACGSDDDPAPKPASSAGAGATVDYVDVPDGVELTEPGAELALGETGVIAWEPRDGTVAALELTVDRIERTTFDASFQGWQIDARTAAMTPYFVRARATNVSGQELDGAHVLLWARDDTGTLVDVQQFKEKTFAPCPSSDLPKRFADGDEADVCFVYLMAAGRKLDAVTFPPPGGLDPVTWSGKVATKVQIPKPGKPGKPGKAGKPGKPGKKGTSGQ